MPEACFLAPVEVRSDRLATPAREKNRWSFWIILCGLIAAAVKIVIATRTFGTNDVLTFYLFGKSLSEHGLEETYRTMVLFNHPPVTAYYLRAIYRLHQLAFLRESGITFPFLLRLPGIVADFVVVLLLVRIKRREPQLNLPTWALGLFALSPLSIMVSGYHGNTDPVMVMFLVFSVYFCTTRQPILCGFFLALSCQVKIIPLLFLPFLFFYWIAHRAPLRFSLPFVAASLVLWSEPLLRFPLLFAQNVLAYGSYWGIWGISYLLRLTDRPEFQNVSFFGLSPAQNVVVTACKFVIVASLLILGWRRRHLEHRAVWVSIAYGWLLFFSFAPGACTQYLIWLAPFVLLAFPTFYVFLLASSSIFAFVFYNSISHGLPWYRGVSTNQLNHLWTPWSLLPWLVMLGGFTLFWKESHLKQATATDLPLPLRRQDSIQ